MSERSLGRLERIRTFFLALPPAAALAAFGPWTGAQQGAVDRGGRAEGSATGIAVGKTLEGHFPPARARMTRRGRLSRPDDARIRARTVRVGSHDAERSLTIFEDTLLRRAKRTSEAATSGLKHRGRGENADR